MTFTSWTSCSSRCTRKNRQVHITSFFVVRSCLASSTLAGNLRRLERGSILLTFRDAIGYLQCGKRIVLRRGLHHGLVILSTGSVVTLLLSTGPQEFNIATLCSRSSRVQHRDAVFSIRFGVARVTELCSGLVQHVVENVHDVPSVTQVGCRPSNTVHGTSTSNP